jgi:hypothetical protein
MNNTGNKIDLKTKINSDKNLEIKSIEDKKPILITLKAVDWNAERIWKRINTGNTNLPFIP